MARVAVVVVVEVAVEEVVVVVVEWEGVLVVVVLEVVEVGLQLPGIVQTAALAGPRPPPRRVPSRRTWPTPSTRPIWTRP